MALDSQTNGDEVFLSKNHLKQLITGKKLKIKNYFEASYPEGWKLIVEEFIESIKGCSIEIETITDNHFQLDVQFEVVTRSHELIVWRAVDKLRRASWRTCSECGSEKRTCLRDGDSYVVTKCRSCLRNGKGGTGTWLDRY